MDEAIRRTRRGITVKLEMTQKQELKLTPQMLQSMEILQMSTQELEAYLQELVQENPAAELSEPEERPDEGEELWRRMQSLADQDNQNRQYVAAEREELDPLARIGTAGWRTPFCSTCPGSWSAARPPPWCSGEPNFWRPAWTRPGISGRGGKPGPGGRTARRGAGGGAEPAPDAGPGGRGRA